MDVEVYPSGVLKHAQLWILDVRYLPGLDAIQQRLVDPVWYTIFNSCGEFIGEFFGVQKAL